MKKKININQKEAKIDKNHRPVSDVIRVCIVVVYAQVD